MDPGDLDNGRKKTHAKPQRRKEKTNRRQIYQIKDGVVAARIVSECITSC